MSPSTDSTAWKGLETVVDREEGLLASYAMHSRDTAGRRYPESPHPYRGPYQRDRDRIVHSAAHRRLTHKTQVFTGELGDYHRSRLTHTLEVASIARTLARTLRLNEDLVEALALMHDIGHPPFGHSGEDTLAACLAEVGGFSHNRQALRIVEELEVRYHEFPGLNLSHEVLEGQRFRTEKESAAQSPLLEVQVVDAADSIAYDAHDADDALTLGLLEIKDLVDVPLWHEAAQRVDEHAGRLEPADLRRAVVHELIDWQVGDVLQVAAERLAAGDLDSPQAVRTAPLVIHHSSALEARKRELEQFLFDRVYRHPQVLRVRDQAQSQLRALFDYFVQHPDALGESYRDRVEKVGLKRSVGDYIAGMTDRFAQRAYDRLVADPRQEATDD